MGDIHVTRELLLGVLRGEVPTELLSQVSLQHLLRLCPYCWREFDAFKREVEAGLDAGLILASLGVQMKQMEKEHRRAEQDLRDLSHFPRRRASAESGGPGDASGVAIWSTSSWRKAKRG